MSIHVYDLAVIGLGAYGSSIIYQLSKLGVDVVGIDEFNPPHNKGSSHGDSRITRLAMPEGDQYFKFAKRSHEIWQELEEVTGKKVFNYSGGLTLGVKGSQGRHGIIDPITSSIDSAKKNNLDFRILTSKEIRSIYKIFNINDQTIGYYESSAGYLLPEICIKSQLNLATQNGAKILINERVFEYSQDKDFIKLRTNKANIYAKKIIISAGPFINDLLIDDYKNLFKTYRQVLYWFDIEDNYLEFSRLPVFMWETGGNNEFMYGFPAIDGPSGGIKIAIEQYNNLLDPRNSQEVTQEEVDYIYKKYIKNKIRGISPKCIRSETCTYTVTPDHGFIVDYLPANKNIFIVSACSGHGFKHSASIGEAVAQLLTRNKSDLDLSAFSIKRFN